MLSMKYGSAPLAASHWFLSMLKLTHTMVKANLHILKNGVGGVTGYSSPDPVLAQFLGWQVHSGWQPVSG